MKWWTISTPKYWSRVHATAPTIAPGTSCRVGTPFGVRTRKLARYSPKLATRASRSTSVTNAPERWVNASRLVSRVVDSTPRPRTARNSSDRASRGKNPGRAGPGRFHTSSIVYRADWASPVAPQISTARPTISPIRLSLCSSVTLLVSCRPISGTCCAAASWILFFSSGSPAATSPRIVDRISSSGNTDTRAEWARLEASVPPLSSPYFLTTPTTNETGVYRCWVASTRRMPRSNTFIPAAWLLALTAPDQRQDKPQPRVQAGNRRGDDDGRPAGLDERGDQEHRAGNGQADRGHPGDGHHVGRLDQVVLHPAAEHQPVVGDRAQQQRGGDRGHDERRLVQLLLPRLRRAELGGERQRQQEAEQHLHAKPGHPQFLEQLDQPAVCPLVRALVPGVRGRHRHHLPF